MGKGQQGVEWGIGREGGGGGAICVCAAFGMSVPCHIHHCAAVSAPLGLHRHRSIASQLGQRRFEDIYSSSFSSFFIFFLFSRVNGDFKEKEKDEFPIEHTQCAP